MVCSKNVTNSNFYKQHNWYVHGTHHCASLTPRGGGGRVALIIEMS